MQEARDCLSDSVDLLLQTHFLFQCNQACRSELRRFLSSLDGSAAIETCSWRHLLRLIHWWSWYQGQANCPSRMDPSHVLLWTLRLPFRPSQIPGIADLGASMPRGFRHFSKLQLQGRALPLASCLARLAHEPLPVSQSPTLILP